MDYTRIVILESIKELQKDAISDIELMALESEFLQQCYENREAIVMEATKDSKLHGVIAGGRKIIDKITKMFLDMAEKKFKARFDSDTCSRIRQNMEAVKANCLKVSAPPMVEFWKANWKNDASVISKAINDAYNNASNGKYDDYTFASKIISDTTMVQKRDTAQIDYIRTYFLNGDNKSNSAKEVKVSGKDLVGKLDDILNFVESYEKVVPKLVENINNEFKNRTKSVNMYDSSTGSKENVGAVTNDEKKEQNSSDNNNKEKQANETFIFNSETFLNVEGKKVCETDIPLFMGYQSLLEANDQQNGGGNNTSNGNNDKASETQSGGKATDVKFEISDGKPMSKQEAEKKNTDKTNNNDNRSDNATSKINKGYDYLNNITFFFERCVSCYTTALEKRFVVYANLLSLIAADYVKTPTQDNNQDNNNDKNKNDKANKKNNKNK